MRIDDSTEAQNTETWQWESNIRMNATETRYLLVDDHLYCNREDHNRCHKGNPVQDNYSGIPEGGHWQAQCQQRRECL